MLILVDRVQARGIDFIASHEHQIACRAAKLIPHEFAVDDLPNSILVVLLTDVFAGLLSRHERSASACRTALRPNLIKCAFEESCLVLRLPQIGLGGQTIPLGSLLLSELLLGGFDAKFHSRFEGICGLVEQLAWSLRVSGAQPVL
jgi:hypothetical protein